MLSVADEILLQITELHISVSACIKTINSIIGLSYRTKNALPSLADMGTQDQ